MTGISGAQEFHKLITGAKSSNTYGAQVSVHDVQKYKDMRLFTTTDGKAGFAIDNEGTLVSLFSDASSPHKSISTELVMLAIEQGARKLDNYDTFLTGIYKKLGFVETERFPWDESIKPDDWNYDTYWEWNKGRPDYVFMEYKPAGGLVDQLVDGGKLDVPNTPAAVADDIDLSRFDDTLKDTVQ